MNTDEQILKLHANDNVAIALVDLPADGVRVREAIPAGHKLALSAIAAGEPIVKFGQPIGTATAGIASGCHVHVHNISASVEGLEGVASPMPGMRGDLTTDVTFEGYRRSDGRAGTRNYIGIISTVNCSATVIRQIAAQFPTEALQDFANVDGVCPITHTTGCGMSAKGAGIDLLRRTLAGYIRHANMGGVLVVGLGCEVNDIRGLLDSAGLAGNDTLRTMSIQDAGGTRAAVAQGVETVRELIAIANRSQRAAVPASELTLGLQCGGSDSFSGVTANPALGYASDRLVAAGGTVILGETPEIHGAEHLLLRRAESGDVADALNERLAWWQQYVAAHGASLNNNPSPGNIAGGISTILEKSLGAVMKSGTSPLCGVYQYGELVMRHGFVFMDSPGYDPCSITGEIASGANIVCFTTGRGSVFGAKPVPSVKLATNTTMAERMADDIDYDCGKILSGGKTLAEAGDDIFRLLLDTASGKRSASELNGLGDFEFVPWQLGAVL